MKVLVFDVTSDYAHFRQPYSTTSSLTYAIPPRTALFGLIGAILGIDSGGFGKSSHFEILENAGLKTSVRILNPIEKARSNMNYTYTKSDIANKKVLHIQVPVEIVKEPVYRIYVTGDDKELIVKLKKMIMNKECYYTPYLGISEFIATVRYVGFYNSEVIFGKTKVDSIVYLLEGTEFLLEPGLKIFKETHALSMNKNRHVTRYIEIAYEAYGKGITVEKSDPETIIVNLPISNSTETVMLM